MMQLSSLDSFSNDPFDVQVTSDKVPDMELIDLPGIITNPNQKARCVSSNWKGVAVKLETESVFTVHGIFFVFFVMFVSLFR